MGISDDGLGILFGKRGGGLSWCWWRMSNHCKILFLGRWREEKKSPIVKRLVKGQVQHLFEI